MKTSRIHSILKLWRTREIEKFMSSYYVLLKFLGFLFCLKQQQQQQNPKNLVYK